MRVTVIGKNIDVTPALKEIVERKISKLDRYFEPDVSARATLTVQKNSQIFEVTIPFNGVILRCEESTDDMYKSIDLVFDKVERQIHKYKTRLAKRFKESNVLNKQFVSEKESVPGEGEFEIVRQKRFTINPMSPEEAILQMNLLGHNFFMFFNSETEAMAVVYRRDDGKYGLIDAAK